MILGWCRVSWCRVSWCRRSRNRNGRQPGLCGYRLLRHPQRASLRQQYEDLLKDLRADYDYRIGSHWRTIKYALTYPAARAGGLQPAFLDDLQYLARQVWPYALHAVLAYVRAAANRTGLSVPDVARRLAAAHSIQLD